MDRHTWLAAALLVPVLAGAACQETATDATTPLAIECTAIPPSGPAPLTVAFGLSVSNAVGAVSVRIDYGDGSQGTDPGARHVYPTPGAYAASIMVSAGAAIGTSISGRAPLRVLYNLCRSQDPDGDGLFFRMDLDGDGRYEHFGTTGADCSREATYAVGTRTITLCVTDGYCPAWPLCEDLPRWRFHPYQCMSYDVTATP